LITSKFSIFAEAVNAVWMWKKLVLRGSTRNAKGNEELAYFKGGFGRLAEALAIAITNAGGEISYGVKVLGSSMDGSKIRALRTGQEEVAGHQFLFTPAFPIIADILDDPSAGPTWLSSLRRVRYLGNMCLVLRLKQSLSDTYWLNVNDPGFPFVGVIEHTNFDLPENYDGSHIAFLSRYLAVDDPAWKFGDEEYLDFALNHLKRMFPEMDRSWIIEYRVWRSEHAQPVTERNYSKYVPGHNTPFENAHIATMAQIYPEDRGTNYAIRDGRAIAATISTLLEETGA
jgi:protoporphyrinogen oxidase